MINEGADMFDLPGAAQLGKKAAGASPVTSSEYDSHSCPALLDFRLVPISFRRS